MSLATLLLAFLPAIVRPNPEPEKSARERELEARVKELEEDLDYVKLERDSARRRLDDAWDTMSRLAENRIDRRLYQHAQQLAAQAAQSQFGQMQAMQNAHNAHNAFAHPYPQGELIDCTGGGRARYLGLIGGV